MDMMACHDAQRGRLLEQVGKAGAVVSNLLGTMLEYRKTNRDMPHQNNTETTQEPPKKKPRVI